MTVMRVVSGVVAESMRHVEVNAQDPRESEKEKEALTPILNMIYHVLSIELNPILVSEMITS